MCGESMVPRSDPYENYFCIGRKIREEGCAMPDLPRVMVDDAVRRYFESVGLDLAKTREAIAETTQRKLAQARALHADAERTLARIESQIARADSDYLGGTLDAERWLRLDTRLAADLQAAQAEQTRLAQRGGRLA
jgi:hypothetical protein